MKPHKALTALMQPLLNRNNSLVTETLSEKINRVKMKFNLYHGKGKRKHNKK